MSESPKDAMVMSHAERSKASVMIVEKDATQRGNMRTALRQLGYGGISEAPNHAQALEKMDDRKFTHILFDAKDTNMKPVEFLNKVMEQNPQCIAIPSSFEPNVDDVFDLLIKGAKGYLCKPFTIDTLESAIVMASKGEPMSEAVLQAKDRNDALVAIMMHSLDKAATIMRQARQFETAKREIPRAVVGLRRAAELAKTFAKGGPDALIDAMERFCIERSKGPATRLGRLRKRLKAPSSIKKEDDSESEQDEATA